MKKILGVIAILGVAAGAVAQGPYSMSIGSGAGSWSIVAGSGHANAGVHTSGWIRGDSELFNPGDIAAANTIWKVYFLVRNDTDNINLYADDTAAHTTKVPNGTLANTATQITNTGINLGATGQTGSLQVDLTAPTAGDTARLNWAWTINNATASAKNYRLIYHFDIDSALEGTYSDDRVGRTDSVMGGTHALGLGESDGADGINLNHGILIDTDTPNTYYGMSNSNGPSNWWRNALGYVGHGMDVTHSIAPSIENTVENDADTDGFSDSGLDSGGALQVNITVPANDSATVNFSATWGLNQVLSPDSSVGDWSLYN